MTSALARQLSTRVLVLTVGFVLLAELLLFIPSVASFRQDKLAKRADAAVLVTEALMSREADLSGEARAMLAKRFMMQTGAERVTVMRGPQVVMALGGEPPARIADTEDLRVPRRFPPLLPTAREFFTFGGDAHLRVIAPAPAGGAERLEIFVPCAALGEELRAYGTRILGLSVMIALIVGALIYAAIRRIIVQPVREVAADMTAFREAPQMRRRFAPPSQRPDEIGQLQREFHEMKQSLREAFRERERLANLGLSVTKINHDLRNVLSTALLMADRLSAHAEPELAQMGERLARTVERGVGLTEEVLEYSSAREPAPVLEAVRPHAVARDVRADLHTAFPAVRVDNRVAPDLVVRADAEQLHRILSNLARNAAQAMRTQGDARIVLEGETVGDATLILRISDNGPGLPDKVRDRLFLPFTRGDAEGSTGLGLSIAKELAEKMGGSLELLDTGPSGTTFILGLPRL